MACSGVSRAMGGSTPKASAARNMTLLRMTANSGNHRVLNEVDGISSARVLGERDVGVIGLARGVENDIFQHRAEADGAEDLRLLLFGQVDALGVAAAFKVEDAGRAPAVLVVADQAAGGVGRERGFAGAARGRRRAPSRHPRRRWPSSAWAARPRCGTRKFITPKMDFFISPAYLVPPMRTMLAGEIGEDEGAGAGAVALGNGLELGRGDDRELGHMRGQAAASGRTKSWRTNSACQAYSAMTRMGSR